MGFPSYFNKDIIALNKLVSTDTGTKYREKLEDQIIGIEFDQQISESFEARCCAELLVRILVRFYPKISFIGKESTPYIAELKNLALEINSSIEFVNQNISPTVLVSLSSQKSRHDKQICFYLGSEEWNAKLSTSTPQNFGISNNPIGCGVVACIAASNIFRVVFADELNSAHDNEVRFSAYNLKNELSSGPNLDKVILDDLTLVGVGAIGSAAVWALSKLKGLSGKITLVDHDKIEESNLQRYILFHEAQVKKYKSSEAAKLLKRKNLKIDHYNFDWATFVSQIHKGKCNASLVATAVDSKEDRINIQGSLPKKIFNAYTDESRLGITRHTDFNTKPCLACIYIPEAPIKSKLEIMTEELNMVGHETIVLAYMQKDKLIDDIFLNAFCANNKITYDDVKSLTGKNLGEFYIEMVCGYGMIEFDTKNQTSEQLNVPLSFQSCLAGLLLVAEILLDVLGENRPNVKDVSQLEVLETINNDNPHHTFRIKNNLDKCICGDIDFLDVYCKKWKATL